MTETAPFLADITRTGSGARALWINAKDGVRLRVGIWSGTHSASGTVFLLPGRTEFIEKYAHIAADFRVHGLDSIALDWRGQGLADRLAKDPMLGHVDRFEDYQLDVEAMFDIAQAQDMPKPWYLLAHSMGGGIALRTVMNGAPIDACAFSGPMWGIKMNPALRPAAWVISALASKLGLGSRFAPTTGRESYVATEPFETNALTRDADMHGFMQSQLIAYPRLQLGGPSLTWLFEALKETRALARHPSPNIPCITLMGSEETVVEAKSIPDRMNRWPGSALHVEPGGLHELLMEDAETRKPLVAKICQYFAENASAS